MIKKFVAKEFKLYDLSRVAIQMSDKIHLAIGWNLVFRKDGLSLLGIYNILERIIPST